VYAYLQARTEVSPSDTQLITVLLYELADLLTMKEDHPNCGTNCPQTNAVLTLGRIAVAMHTSLAKVRVYTSIYIYIYICVCVCMYVYIYIYIYICRS